MTRKSVRERCHHEGTDICDICCPELREESERPPEDAFESAWREYNAKGNAGGWERVAFISGFGKGFKAGLARSARDKA